MNTLLLYKIDFPRLKQFKMLLLRTLMIVLVSSCSSSKKEVADWVLINGKILTVDADFTIAEAIAIKDGLVFNVGSNEEIDTYIGTDTKVTDLKKKTVIPGLIDNHLHYVRATKHWYRMVRWDAVKTRTQAIKLLKERAETLPKNEWVLVLGGFIFEQFQDDSNAFTLDELDKILPNRPLYIQLDYSRAFANSAALKAAGVTKNTTIKSIGEFIKNEKGELTGELTFKAMDKMYNAFPEPSQEVWDQSLKQTVDSLLSKGLTTVYDVGGNTVTNDFYESVNRLSTKGELNMRVFYSLNGQNSNVNSARDIMNELKSKKPDYQDLNFSQFGYGETVYSPMRSTPFKVSKEDQELFKNIVITAIENNWQIHEHTMREAKMKLMLDILEPISKSHPRMKDLRFTIAHTNEISEASIQRAINMHMVFAVHSVCRQMPNTNLAAPPAHTINKMGGIWGLGSDATVMASPNPFHTIGWVVSGHNSADKKLFQQTVSREEALRAHTATNAYILFKEDKLGSLESGKQADFVVLNKDYMSVPVTELEELTSLMTVVNGKVVYNKKSQ